MLPRHRRELLDTDHNGQVSREEFTDGLKLLNDRLPAAQQLGGDADAINALFDAIDTDRTGLIDASELGYLLVQFSLPYSERPTHLLTS